MHRGCSRRGSRPADLGPGAAQEVLDLCVVEEVVVDAGAGAPGDALHVGPAGVLLRAGAAAAAIRQGLLRSTTADWAASTSVRQGRESQPPAHLFGGGGEGLGVERAVGLAAPADELLRRCSGHTGWRASGQSQSSAIVACCSAFPAPTFRASLFLVSGFEPLRKLCHA
jgi:hypothetical protein